MPSGKFFGRALEHAFAARINFASDTIKAALLTSAYTPDQDTHDYFDDVSATQVAVVSTTLAAAASAGATTVSSTASVAVGNFVNIDGEVRKVTAVSGAGPYTLTLISALSSAHASGAAVTSGQGYTAGGITLTSKTVTYTAGTNTLSLDAADLSLTGNPLGARYAVIYKDTGTPSTSPLLGYVDFDDDKVATGGGTLQIQWDATGVIVGTTPA